MAGLKENFQYPAPSDLVEVIRHVASRGGISAVFVCGLGGCGKSSMCRSLACQIETPVTILEIDWFLRYSTPERRNRIRLAQESGDLERLSREENPQLWYDWESFKEGLYNLKDTGSLRLEGAWNQKTGEKDLVVDLELPSEGSGVVLCDGIYLLDPTVSDFADFIVLLEISPELARERGEHRDAHRSSPEYLAYKARLAERYDQPYFKRFRARANKIVLLR